MKLYDSILSGLLAILLLGCEKSDSVLSISSDISGEVLPYSVEIKTKVNSTSRSIVSSGICWSTAEIPTGICKEVKSSNKALDENQFVSTIDNLQANTTYYVRTFVVCENDTIYGNAIKIKTPDYLLFNPYTKYGSVTDVDGNEYKTVTIGGQTWMAENLRTTHFQNGEAIRYIPNGNEWGLNYETPAYSWYGNDKENRTVYGAYYNWQSAFDKRNIAPKGWRVPTKDDWATLFKNIQNNSMVLREESSAHWTGTEYYKASNATGLTIVSTGVNMGDLYSAGLRQDWTLFWTSDGTPEKLLATAAFIQLAGTDFIEVQSNHGYPIRCIKE